MAKNRKKRTAARRPERSAQAQAAKQHGTKGKTMSAPKSPAPTADARRWVGPVAIVLVIAAALLVSQTLFGKEAARPATPWTLTILHTTDVSGYLDPCG